MKKIILTCLAFISAISVSFAGTYSGGSGTEGDPYRISTLEDLIEIRTSGDYSQSKFFIQTGNIVIDADETNVDWDGDGDAVWDAEDQSGFLGADGFRGTYDGDGFYIENLFVNRPGWQSAALFRSVQNATVKNLGLVNCDITSAHTVGAIAGWTSNSLTVNCYATGTVSTGDSGDQVGGLFGVNGSDATIRNCYAIVAVDGDDRIGGLIGRNGGTIEFCYSSGTVSGNTNVGGLVGEDQSGTYTSNYWDTETSGQANSGGEGVGAIEGKSTANMKLEGTYNCWDFTGTWDIDPGTNNGYPYLIGLDDEFVNPVAESAPTTQATTLIFSTNPEDVNNLGVTWTNGNGDGRAVFMKAGNSGTAAPADGTVYTANANFGDGDQIGATGWYCVSGGTGNSVSVDNLTQGTEYQVHVCEYNGTLCLPKYLTDAATNNPKSFTMPYSEVGMTYDGESVSDGENIDLGNTNALITTDYTFTVLNVGSEIALNLTGDPLVEITGADADKFELFSPPSLVTMPAGSTSTFVIRYTPETEETNTCTISVANDESNGDENPYTLNLSVTASVEAVDITPDDSDGDTKPEVDFSAIPAPAGTIAEKGYKLATDYAMTENVVWIVDGSVDDLDGEVNANYIRCEWDEYDFGTHYYCRWYIKYDDDTYEFGPVSAFEKNEGSGVIKIGE